MLWIVSPTSKLLVIPGILMPLHVFDCICGVTGKQWDVAGAENLKAESLASADLPSREYDPDFLIQLVLTFDYLHTTTESAYQGFLREFSRKISIDDFYCPAPLTLAKSLGAKPESILVPEAPRTRYTSSSLAHTRLEDN